MADSTDNKAIIEYLQGKKIILENQKYPTCTKVLNLDSRPDIENKFRFRCAYNKSKALRADIEKFLVLTDIKILSGGLGLSFPGQKICPCPADGSFR
jgi:hypothetical protein